jgi:putative transposase
MLKAYKYRIYPNNTQKVLLAKTFGCVRFFWNNQVAVFNSYDKEVNPSLVYKTSTQIRKEYEWMKEVSAAAIQQKEIDFKDLKKQVFNKNRKTKTGFPQFKNKNSRQSYRLPNQKFVLMNDKIRLEKIGWVKVVSDQDVPENSKFMNVTVSKNNADQYFISVLVETEIKQLPKTNKSVGIDLGLKEFFTQSDNIVVANPRYFRENQAKLKRVQQHLSRKKKGSSRWIKTKLKVSRLHNTISNKRNYFLHTESTKLIKAYDTIYIEDLNVSGMVKNRKLAKSISDVSWSSFTAMLSYKAEWYGKEVIKIDRFSPSSKTCSSCGNVKKDLTLSNRVYCCNSCGFTIDRDLNAAINIKALGVNNAIRTQSDCKTSEFLEARCGEVSNNEIYS